MIKKSFDTLSKIEVLPLFPEINRALISLLKSLSSEEWDKPTVLPGRSVKDLASHILDGSLRRLSFCRDNYQSKATSFKSNEELIRYVQELNSAWIVATKRLSPQILISLLELSEQWLLGYFKTLDLDSCAKLPVSWQDRANRPTGLIWLENILKNGIIKCRFD